MDINPVLFGVLDVEVQQQQGVYDNVCFGKTMWLAESPSKDQLKCRECGEVCSLLVQSKKSIYVSWRIQGVKGNPFLSASFS